MARSNLKFNTLYRQLNPAQKEAVDAIEGPVMVVAGPGTGKTHILTLRIANILRQTDAEPENILALTFTEAGAAEMRRRLADIIGSPAYRVEIATFHGFCNGLIERYPEFFPRIIGSRVISEVEQITQLKEIIDSKRPRLLRPFGNPYFHLRGIREAISHLKKENITPQKFVKTRVKDKRSQEKNKELAILYAAYQKELAKRELYDYEDMILEVINTLEPKVGKDLLLTLQEQYQWLLADEHQDANLSQNKVLELLASYYRRPNLFVVGDEKQAIFRFQGASLENFTYFSKKYPAAVQIQLEVNYRSTQPILDAAACLLASVDLRSFNQKVRGEPITFYEFSRPDIEHYFVLRSIQEKLERGERPQEIAILYRDNRDAEPITRLLEKAGVPFVVESDQNVLDDLDIQKLVALLRAVEGFGKNAVLVPALHIDFLGLEPLEVYSIVSSSTPWQVFKSSSAGGLYNNLKRWRVISQNAGAVEAFETIVRESGFLAHLLSHPASAEKLEKLDRLYEEVKALVEQKKDSRLADILGRLDIVAEHKVALSRRVGGWKNEHVRLMTAHRAKGREFNNVYIVGAWHGHWGGRRRPQFFDLSQEKDENEERRLFYVALTRARKSVTISTASASSDGRPRVKSEFVGEIKPGLIKEANPAPWEKQFNKEKELAFAAPVVESADLVSAAFVKDAFLNHGFAVTHLNNYLRCPWRYFYVNLVRVPQASSAAQMYGSAIHGALRNFFKKYPAGKGTAKTLLSYFNRALLNQPLAEADYERFYERGKNALAGYLKKNKGTLPASSLLEFNIRGVEFAQNIILTGELDKIEFLGRGSEVNVVDYKTGVPKSRNAILGKTKIKTAPTLKGRGSDRSVGGDYWRQLVFYKLLLDRQGKYRMVSGELDFVEPTKAGQYKKEKFEVTNADVKELEELIRTVTTEILSLGFWQKRCDDAKCEYCKLKEMMT